MITTNIINLSNENKIVDVDGEAFVLKGLVVNTDIDESSLDIKKVRYFPIVGEGWITKNEIYDGWTVERNIIGNIGDKIRVADLTDFIDEEFERNGTKIYRYLKSIKKNGIELLDDNVPDLIEDINISYENWGTEKEKELHLVVRCQSCGFFYSCYDEVIIENYNIYLKSSILKQTIGKLISFRLYALNKIFNKSIKVKNISVKLDVEFENSVQFVRNIFSDIDNELERLNKKYI